MASITQLSEGHRSSLTHTAEFSDQKQRDWTRAKMKERARREVKTRARARERCMEERDVLRNLEEANRAHLPYPDGPPMMKAPSKPSNPAPIMKPPPTKAPEVTVTDMVKAQPTQRPGFKGPPAGVGRPGFKPPPAGIPVPPWAPAATPVPSSSPAGVKAKFKGPPANHPDFGKEVPITYLPFTPKNPPPQMPVVTQQQLFKPPPAPGYGGLTPEEYKEAQEKYRRELANRRARANRNPDVDERRDYGSGSASSGTQPGDRAAAAAPSQRDDGNPFSRRRAPNKMSSAYGPAPPPYNILRYPHQLELR
eukprot:2319459-Amphidinium_carterae.1